MTKTMTASDLQRLDVGDPQSVFAPRPVAACNETDKLQLNLIIVPQQVSGDFKHFCLANAKACPVVAIGRPGETTLRRLGIRDIRLSAIGYDVQSEGKLVERTQDISALWRDDLVGFVLGSAGVLDVALRQKGINPRLPWSNAQPRYRTRLSAVRVGPFAGDLIVSMRAVNARHIDRLRAICARYPGAHGAPVHVGDPTELGIDLSHPDWGLPIQVGPGEVPVFFASSMTARLAVASADLPLAIVTSPSQALVSGLHKQFRDSIAA